VTVYLQADMELYFPERKYDIIVFSESLYFANDPLDLIKRYMSFVSQDGIIITSIHNTNLNAPLIESLEEQLDCVEKHLITNEGGTWFCHVFCLNHNE